MTSTSDTRDDLREYDATAVLEAVTRERRTADRAEARLLDLAVHWVDLHPVTEEHQAATPQHAGGLFGGPDVRPALAGEGTPGIAEFAVEELAAALGIGYQSGFRLCEEAVELCFRLPRLWALVQAGRLQAWKGRQVARETKHLSREAVAFVDRHVATLARRNRLPLSGRWCTKPGCSATPTRPMPSSRSRWTDAACGSTTASRPQPRRSPPGSTRWTRSTSSSRSRTWRP